MYLANELLRRLELPGLSANERALLRCRLAKRLEQGGDYEAAAQAMVEFWPSIEARPILEGLGDETKALVLLRIGALTGWIGSANQLEGSQERAKDLISESARAFEGLGQRKRVAEARSDLALCYWREGAFDEARVTLEQALDEFDDADLEHRAIALLRKGIIERTSGRLNEALRVYEDAVILFDQVTDHLLTAHFHHAFANALKDVTANDPREDYADHTLMEYTAASFHFEQAGHIRYQACVENNIGSLLGIIGRFDDAHHHLDRAQMLMTRLKDNVHLAQVDETRARVMLSEGRIVEAEKTVRSAVRALEKGDELSLLAEALTTEGIALARLHHTEQARAALDKAMNVAEQIGDSERAGMAALSLMEELPTDASNEDFWPAVNRAGVLLEQTRNIGVLRRVAKAFRALRDVLAPNDWTKFSLRDAIHRYEAHLIKLALREAGGSVTRAARLLGFKHHQSLISLISGRHTELNKERSTIRKRRRHLMAHPKRKVKGLATNQKSQVMVLHVEDNEAVASVVRDSLEPEGWNIETCVDGTLALKKIGSDAHYDLVLLDNDLPGVSGLDLIRSARSMDHRRETPIIVLSAKAIEREALDAGANAVLRKPGEIGSLADTVARFLRVQRVGRADSSEEIESPDFVGRD